MKILVIRYRFIGDTLLTVPFLRNLRKHYPKAQIDMLVSPVSGDVLKDCPYIDNLIYFDTTKKHRYEKSEKKRTLFSYAMELRKEKYDKAYVLKRSLSSAFLAFLTGAKQRIGFNTEGRGLLLTKRVPYSDKEHEVECFLNILRADNISVKDNHLENWVNPKDEKVINKILEPHKDDFKVQIHATSGNLIKQWPLENFAKIIEYLINEKNAKIFYLGASSDSKYYDEIRSLLKSNLKSEPINMCGKLSINESSALTSKMDLLIGNDSGNLHIAASYGVKTIGIYGPMSTTKWGLRGDIHTCITSDVDCSPCNLKIKCKKNKACLKAIKPDKIINEVDKFF